MVISLRSNRILIATSALLFTFCVHFIQASEQVHQRIIFTDVRTNDNYYIAAQNQDSRSLASPNKPSNLRRTNDYSSSTQQASDLAGQACRPRHIHLSVGRNQNATHSSMIVSFSFPPKCRSIYMKSCPECKVNSIGGVVVGEDPDNLSTLVLSDEDDIVSYNASLTEQQMKRARSGDRYFSDIYHHVEVTNLKPGTRYHYKCILMKEDSSTPAEEREDSTIIEERVYQMRHESSIMAEDVDDVDNDESERRLTQQNLRGIRSQQSPTGEPSNFHIISESSTASFLTPPAPGEWYPPPLDRSIKFAVLGDLGARSHSRETVSKLEHNRLEHKINDENIPNKESTQFTREEFHQHHGQGIDCVLLAGDISYSNRDHTIWDDWLEMMSDHDFFMSIPLQIALGNHDLDYDPDSLEIALAYENRFRMPQVQPAIRGLAVHELFHKHDNFQQAKGFLPYEYGNAYYSFTFGPSKHIVLSSYSSFLPGSTQHDWLLSELESVDRSVTPWLIIMLHCPLYSTFEIHQDEIYITEARKHLEPIFLQYVVNFVIAGHIHSYMRTVPTAFSAPHPRGPIYVIQGNGGRNANEPYVNSTQESWVQIRDHSMFGYGLLELINVTHAKWNWIKTGFNADGEGGKNRYEPDFGIHDDVWVKNQWFSAEDEYLDDEEESS